MASQGVKAVNRPFYKWLIFGKKRIKKRIDDSYQLLAQMTDYKDSPSCKEKQQCSLTEAKDAFREGANKQVMSSQADSLIKISRIWADFCPANTSNQPI